jgi:hypothetical protein
MMPPSYRIEKAIYAIWHAIVVFFWLKFTQQDFIDLAQSWGFEASTGRLWAGIWAVYGFWQMCLLFLHGFVNALLGVVLPYFNFGSYERFFRYQIAAFFWSIPNVGPTGFRNIDDVIRFREAKMGAISTEEGAELLVETSALDQVAGMATGNYGRNHRQAAQLLNAKLGAMTQRQGLEYMRGRQL